MTTRRTFLRQTLVLGASGLMGAELGGCASYSRPAAAAGTHAAAIPTRSPDEPKPAPSNRDTRPPDLFDAATLDIDFWIKPRTLSLYRPQTGERTKVLYWKDGHIPESVYQQLCHILRDVQGKQTVAMDPKLLEILWASQAFVSRFGMTAPVEVLSGYRTAATNHKLHEQGIPAARKSLHMEARAADIRIPNVDAGVLGKLVQSFRTGGVGFYYRPGAKGGWIHTDTGLQRTWKG